MKIESIEIIAAQIVAQLDLVEVVAIADGELGTLARRRVGTLCSRLHDSQSLVEAIRARCEEVSR